MNWEACFIRSVTIKQYWILWHLFISIIRLMGKHDSSTYVVQDVSAYFQILLIGTQYLVQDCQLNYCAFDVI